MGTMSKNEEIVRSGYAAAEGNIDLRKFRSLFTSDGVIFDASSGTEFRGDDVRRLVEVFATAFPDMHRAIGPVYTTADRVIVELTLNGTHKGPLVMPGGTLPATGKKMSVPCCDVFYMTKEGKIERFNCYPSGTVMFAQLGVLGNLGAALKP